MKALRIAMGAAIATGCGSSRHEQTFAVSGPDSGVVVLADGGTAPSYSYDAGEAGIAPAVVLPPATDPFIADRTRDSQLPASTIDTLRTAATAAGAGTTPGGGGSNPSPSSCSELLYPYEGTVMPGGLLSPPWMFTSGFDAAYLRVGYAASNRLDYQFAAAATSPAELRIPGEDWANIVNRTPGVPLTLTFAFSRGGVTSTCVARMSIAAGNMTGAIYYNTYNHPESAGTGSILRLTLGHPQPEMYLREPLAVAPIGPCIGCHSLSAQGNVLAASTHMYAGSVFVAKSYAVEAGASPMPLADIKDAAFAAITPDGKEIFRMGNPDCTQGADIFPRSPNNFPLTIGPTTAGLLSTETGNLVASTGLLPDHFYWMPQFSPDGRLLVFNDGRIINGVSDRRELAIADYDPATHAFSAPRTLLSKGQIDALGLSSPSRDYAPLAIGGGIGLVAGAPGADGCFGTWDREGSRTGSIPKGACDGPCFPGWPFFTPDGKGVIFAMVSEPDFAVAFPGREAPSKSELWYADVATGQVVRLDNANRALPGADTQDNYYPTVLPVQVGGYYWLFWTSRRAFGHRELSPGIDGVLTGALIGSSAAAEAYRKRIWVSAIRPPGVGEFAATSLTDPSLPPFYLEGQSATGNTRAFAALNPCEEIGADCLSGLDCCTGFCNTQTAGTPGTCGEKITCANLNERCATSDDCCKMAGEGDPALECIGGYCGFLLVR